MREYRIFHLDEDGNILGPSRGFQAEDEDAALREAREGVGSGIIVEVWEGPRRVATIRSNNDDPFRGFDL
jgi:hypothetical protein